MHHSRREYRLAGSHRSTAFSTYPPAWRRLHGRTLCTEISFQEADPGTLVIFTVTDPVATSDLAFPTHHGSMSAAPSTRLVIGTTITEASTQDNRSEGVATFLRSRRPDSTRPMSDGERPRGGYRVRGSRTRRRARCARSSTAPPRTRMASCRSSAVQPPSSPPLPPAPARSLGRGSVGTHRRRPTDGTRET
jgi:hypothetical protein